MAFTTSDDKLFDERLRAAEHVEASMPLPSSRGRDRLRTVGQIVLGVLLGLAIWQFFAVVMNANGSVLGFPYPLETFQRLAEYLFTGETLYGHSIYEHLLASLRRLIIAFALAAATGIVLGSVLGSFQRIYPQGIDSA